MADKKMFEFTVPEKDVSVLKWLDEQDDLSMSLRCLIKEDIMRNGCRDVTCRPISVDACVDVDAIKNEKERSVMKESIRRATQGRKNDDMSCEAQKAPLKAQKGGGTQGDAESVKTPQRASQGSTGAMLDAKALGLLDDDE